MGRSPGRPTLQESVLYGDEPREEPREQSVGVACVWMTQSMCWCM